MVIPGGWVFLMSEVPLWGYLLVVDGGENVALVNVIARLLGPRGPIAKAPLEKRHHYQPQFSMKFPQFR